MMIVLFSTNLQQTDFTIRHSENLWKSPTDSASLMLQTPVHKVSLIHLWLFCWPHVANSSSQGFINTLTVILLASCCRPQLTRFHKYTYGYSVGLMLQTPAHKVSLIHLRLFCWPHVADPSSQGFINTLMVILLASCCRPQLTRFH